LRPSSENVIVAVPTGVLTLAFAVYGSVSNGRPVKLETGPE